MGPIPVAMQLWNNRPPAHPFDISFLQSEQPEPTGTLKANARLVICVSPGATSLTKILAKAQGESFRLMNAPR